MLLTILMSTFLLAPAAHAQTDQNCIKKLNLNVETYIAQRQKVQRDYCQVADAQFKDLATKMLLGKFDRSDAPATPEVNKELTEKIWPLSLKLNQDVCKEIDAAFNKAIKSSFSNTNEKTNLKKAFTALLNDLKTIKQNFEVEGAQVAKNAELTHKEDLLLGFVAAVTKSIETEIKKIGDVAKMYAPIRADLTLSDCK